MGRFRIARNEDTSRESVGISRKGGLYGEGEYGELRRFFEELLGGEEGEIEGFEGFDWNELWDSMIGGGQGSNISPNTSGPFFSTGKPIQYW